MRFRVSSFKACLADCLSEAQSLPSDEAKPSRASGVSDGLPGGRESGVGSLNSKAKVKLKLETRSWR